MKLREREEHLDPRAERELDAVDRALAGKPVDPDLTGWAELTALLEAERPEPGQAWSAELDERAARGFRREGGGGPSAREIADRLLGILPRRLAAPVGAVATLAIVAVVAVSTLGGNGTEDSSLVPSSGGALLEGGSVAEEALNPDIQPIDATDGRLQEIAPASAGSDDSGASLDEYVASPPFTRQGSKIAPGTEKRQVERDVSLTLSAKPEEVSDVSDEAIAITRSLDGIVVSSQVTKAGRQANATLQLTIPTRNLDTALDRLTEIADVKSLNESTLDITRPYVSTQDRLDDAEAERQALLQALGNASTDAEAEALRLQINDARREISRAESAFENVARRARLSDISLSVQGDPGAAGKDDDARTIGDWLDDTVSVLRDLAGVLLITAAIVVPLSILAAIGWFVTSGLRRRRRERTLDS